MEFQAVSGPKFTGLFFVKRRRNVHSFYVFRLWISLAVPEIFAIKIWSGSKLTEILHVFGPQFLGGPPPIFWSQFIKFSQIPTMWQSFRAIGRGSSENPWRNKKKTSGAKYKPVLGCSGRPHYTNNNSILHHLFDRFDKILGYRIK